MAIQIPKQSESQWAFDLFFLDSVFWCPRLFSQTLTVSSALGQLLALCFFGVFRAEAYGHRLTPPAAPHNQGL